jgi:hypothetical protein
VGYLGFLIVPPLVGSVAQLAGLRSAYAMMAGFGILITVLVQFTLDDKNTLDGKNKRPAATLE